jgi:hypothetical protein
MKTTGDRLALARKEVQELEEQLVAEGRSAKEQRQTSLRDVADEAHGLLCAYNHTDGCSWGYEGDKPDAWKGWAHQRWLDKVEAVIAGDRGDSGIGANEEEVRAAVKALATAKHLNPKLLVIMDALRRA